MQASFGPFVSAFLTTQGWTQVQIGEALSLGTVVGTVAQVPVGAAVDRMADKRRAAAGALVCVAVAALLLGLWPAFLPVAGAELLHSVASCALGPAIAAISLTLAARARPVSGWAPTRASPPWVRRGPRG